MSIMKGKKGIVMGVANERSIAWGIANILARQGAEIAFTYQNEGFKKRLVPLMDSIKSNLCFECDVSQDKDDENSIEHLFKKISKTWNNIDFVVHALAYSDKEELKGKYYKTSIQNFNQSMHISCYSFTEACRLVEPLMINGGSILTLTYYGAELVMPQSCS